MRGKLSDQDLTDYALNELAPEDRLYLESILVVSEECKNDIYELVELGQMLEEGFEQLDEVSQDCALSDSQRQQLVNFRPTVPIWQKVAASLVLGTGAALALGNSGSWQVDDPSGRVLRATTQISEIVAAAVAPRDKFTLPFASFSSFAEDSAHWLPAAAEVFEPVMVCTPPSWLESSSMTALGDMSQ